MQLRAQYPNEVWQKIMALFPDRINTRPVAVDIAVGAEGRGGVELARRGFHVVGVEADPQLLARTFEYAQAHCANVELITAKVEHSLLSDEAADLVTFLHGLHLVRIAHAFSHCVLHWALACMPLSPLRGHAARVLRQRTHYVASCPTLRPGRLQ